MRRSDLIIAVSCVLLPGAVSVLSAQPLPVVISAPEQDKAFSEFNHHLAGLFLVLIGLLAVLAQTSPKLSFLGFFWPLLFILSGSYLAVMSDPDVWPLGAQSWLQAFRGNPEAAQHKLYALLLLSLGVVELQRARGRLPRLIAIWAFPLLAVAGSILLFFHPHSSGTDAMTHAMQGMQHPGHAMTGSMLTVQREHFWFSMVGFCVVIAKFLSDARVYRRAFAPFVWPVFISLLGVLLILYRE